MSKIYDNSNLSLGMPIDDVVVERVYDIDIQAEQMVISIIDD